MLETWERAEINRLEKRIDQLERKNWERSDSTFRMIMHVFTAAFVVLAIAAIVISASQAH